MQKSTLRSSPQPKTLKLIIKCLSWFWEQMPISIPKINLFSLLYFSNSHFTFSHSPLYFSSLTPLLFSLTHLLFSLTPILFFTPPFPFLIHPFTFQTHPFNFLVEGSVQNSSPDHVTPTLPLYPIMRNWTWFQWSSPIPLPLVLRKLERGYPVLLQLRSIQDSGQHCKFSCPPIKHLCPKAVQTSAACPKSYADVMRSVDAKKPWMPRVPRMPGGMHIPGFNLFITGIIHRNKRKSPQTTKVVLTAGDADWICLHEHPDNMDLSIFPDLCATFGNAAFIISTNCIVNKKLLSGLQKDASISSSCNI